VRVFEQNLALEDAIGSHACSLEANIHVTNDIPLGSPLLLPIGTVNCVQTLKVDMMTRELPFKMKLLTKYVAGTLTINSVTTLMTSRKARSGYSCTCAFPGAACCQLPTGC
jgi:hypothetical protein